MQRLGTSGAKSPPSNTLHGVHRHDCISYCSHGEYCSAELSRLFCLAKITTARDVIREFNIHISPSLRLLPCRPRKRKVCCLTTPSFAKVTQRR